MTKKNMTDMLIRDYGIPWETAYQYLWEPEDKHLAPHSYISIAVCSLCPAPTVGTFFHIATSTEERPTRA